METRSVREHLSNVFKSVKPDLGSKKVNEENYIALVKEHFEGRDHLSPEEVGYFLHERETERHRVINAALHRHLDPVKEVLDRTPGMGNFPYY